MREGGGRTLNIFTIPSHRAFADSLAAGLIRRFGNSPTGLAEGRILLPNNRAVRTVTEAFVRQSGTGLLLPRLIPVGDPDLDERIGGALDLADDEEPLPPAIESNERWLLLANALRVGNRGSAEALRLAADLARALDALRIEEVDPSRLRDAVLETDDIAGHWQTSLEQLQLIVEQWPRRLAERGAIDLAERRNRLLRQVAKRWKDDPPQGFTIAAGITTAAPAVAALVRQVTRMEAGEVVLPGLWLNDVMPDEEWEALGSGKDGRGEVNHPQYHLKLLLDRLGARREDVRLWPARGGSASSPSRARSVANAMAAPAFSRKWRDLKPADRRFSGVRCAVLSDPAAEAQAIALAMREVLETPGKTAALVTPDRALAGRVAAQLKRWDISADDSAGRPLSQSPPATLLQSLLAMAAEDFAPVALLSVLKHPLAGGEGDERREWLDRVRTLDLALRGPRPPAGLAGLDRRFDDSRRMRQWGAVRDRITALDGLFQTPRSLADLANRLSEAGQRLCGNRLWSGPAGRAVADLLAQWEASASARALTVDAADAVPLFRTLFDSQSLRPPFGGHPRLFIWGLLEARLQRADLVILGGLNEGVWPALPNPDPWLPPKVRAALNLPTLESRIGLTAHDFASALGAPEVLITRARRDARSPTVASRFWLRLDAISGGLPRDVRLERMVRAIDDPGAPQPVDRPMPRPNADQRPKTISVTAVDRLNSDPFAFYAQAILKLRSLEPVDADFTPAWKGSEVHAVLDAWFKGDGCDPEKLRARAEAMLHDEAIHPMVRALWGPRLLEAIDWIAETERHQQAEGRRPFATEIKGETQLSGVCVQGRADRIDRLPNDGIAIIDYKTGKPPSRKAIEQGFALQLGLLGLIAEAGGFEGIEGIPGGFEYWSMARDRGTFGRRMCADDKIGPEQFLHDAKEAFAAAAARWLTGDDAFTAKLNPAFAPYGDYDQLMRLEEWYGRK